MNLRRVAGLAAVLIPAGMLLTSGTAMASGYDGRCADPNGVAVVCTSDQLVQIGDVDIDVLDDHGWH